MTITIESEVTASHLRGSSSTEINERNSTKVNDRNMTITVESKVAASHLLGSNSTEINDRNMTINVQSEVNGLKNTFQQLHSVLLLLSLAGEDGVESKQCRDDVDKEKKMMIPLVSMDCWRQSFKMPNSSLFFCTFCARGEALMLLGLSYKTHGSNHVCLPLPFQATFFLQPSICESTLMSNFVKASCPLSGAGVPDKHRNCA
jgi:hypothetical protein